LGFVAAGIEDERREANRVKSEQPILVITGSPPYRRLDEGEDETLVGRWMNDLWDDLKEPVRRAGHGNQLNTFPELSVAFWRWAIWKLFEAQNALGRGVVAFISNRTFLTGWPYAGLRQMMRERFDHIEIIDLRGDVRLGAPAGVEGDQGVFDIQVGTAITVAVADGSRATGDLAEVRYLDSWAEARFSRRAKFD
jgi:predicted helicase